MYCLYYQPNNATNVQNILGIYHVGGIKYNATARTIMVYCLPFDIFKFEPQHCLLSLQFLSQIVSVEIAIQNNYPAFGKQ